MSLWPQTAWFPMLRKELMERAARKRTHVVRVIYALCFFGGFLLAYRSWFESTPYYDGAMQGLGALGRGSMIYLVVLVLQLLGILLFLPAMMCGLVTDEKERGTLPLLLLTDISGSEAILQKYFGGLIPMITLLLLTLPVGGVAYLLGGLTVSMVVYGALVLLIFASTVAAIGLACSSYGRTTVGAFMGTYAILGAFYFFPTKLIYPLKLDEIITDGDEFAVFLAASFIVTSIALVAACRCYQSRADVAPKFYVRRLFRAMDRRFKRLNERLGGFELIKDSDNLPSENPILWRERQRRQLGKARYQIRYIVVFMTIAILLALVNIQASPFVSLLAWVIGAIIIVAQASNAVVADRLTQSLDVLLTTPLTGETIILEKARAFLPLLLVVALPIWTLAFFVAVAEWLHGYWNGVWRFVAYETLHLAIFLPLFLLLGLAVGLGAKSRVGAMMKGIGLLVFWCLVPVLAMGIREAFDASWDEMFALYLGPSGVILANRFDSDSHQEHFGFYLLAIFAYIIIGISLAYWCLRNADRKLGRPSEGNP